MIVNVQTGARIAHLHPRTGRIVRSRTPVPVPVEIPEATSDDAPEGLVFPAIREPVRIRDGLLYARIGCTRTSDDDAAWPFSSRLGNMSRMPSDARSLGAILTGYAKRIEGDRSDLPESDGASPNGTPVLDGRGAVASELQSFADRELLLVDGLPYRRVRSPVLTSWDVRDVFGSCVVDRALLPERIVLWFDDVRELLRDAAGHMGFRSSKEAMAADPRFFFRFTDAGLFRSCMERLDENVDLSQETARIGGRHGEAALESFDRDPRSAEETARLLGPAVFTENARAPRRDLVHPAPRTRERIDVVLQSGGSPPTTASVLLSKRLHADFVQTEVPLVDGTAVRSIATHSDAVFPETFVLDGGFAVRLEDLGLPPGAAVDGDDPSGPMGDQFREDEPYPQGRIVPLSKRSLEALGGGGRLYGEQLPLYRPIVRPWDPGPNLDEADEFATHRLVALPDAFMARCPEPVAMVVVPGYPGGRAEVVVSHSWSARMVPGVRPPFMFRLDEAREAADLAAACGWRLRRPPVAPEGVDSGALSFDAAGWNIRAAMSRIVDGIETRYAVAGPEAVDAMLRTRSAVLRWKTGSEATRGPAEDEAFVEDASVVLAALAHPLLDGIVEDGVRDLAERAVADIARRRDTAPEADGEEESYASLVM